jgi:hypothetical protein
MRGFFRFLPADDAGSPGRVLNLTFETNANDWVLNYLKQFGNRGAMFRVLAMLALAVGFDLYMLNGKYTDVAVSMTHTILQHFRVL